MTLATFLQALYDSYVGTTIRESGLLFPWIESFHVLLATTVVGTIAIVDLRLLGYQAHRRSARTLIVELLPFTWLAFVGAVTTGILLFSSNSVGYARNPQFIAKMAMLLLAGINMGIFHLTTYRHIDTWGESLPPPASARMAGAVSLVVWISIVVLGRWIGFTVE